MTYPVGQKPANAWRLYDMTASVLQHCADWFSADYYKHSPRNDPAGPSVGSNAVARGSNYNSNAQGCRSARRMFIEPAARVPSIGIRVVCELVAKADVSKAPTTPGQHADGPGARPFSIVPSPLKKLDPPSPEEQKRLMREIDEVYKPGEAKDLVAKAALARKLLESGRKAKANRAEQFVLLRRAGEIACEAGEADLMLEAVDAIAAAGFNIQPIAVKSRLWKRLFEQSSPDGAHQTSSVSASCVRFLEGAAANGAVDEASEVLDAARNAVAEAKKRVLGALRAARLAMARSRNPADKAAWEKKTAEAQAEQEEVDTALGVLADSAKDLQQARHDHEALQTAQQRLKTAPDDPDACLTVGRWSCFYQGDWDGGLKLLAKGSDDALKSLAAEELASKPTKAEARLARADAWWDVAESAKGVPRSALRRRAAHWYREAMPDLKSDLEKSRVQERLAQVDEEPEAEGGATRARPPLAVAPFSEKAAKIYQARWARFLCLPMVQTNVIGMKLVLIPPGEFLMGSSKELIEQEAKGQQDNSWYVQITGREAPQHRVRITRPFYLGMYLVTQEECWRVMGANPSAFTATGNEKGKVAGQDTRRFPVDSVPWADAMLFCQKLSEMPEEKAAGRTYRLPSEAQWEHACRAGCEGRFGFSPRLQSISREADEKALSEYGWFKDNSFDMPHVVGGKRPSAWGLYDMHGNLWEWCEDWCDGGYYAKSPTDDPTGPREAGTRIIRGGSYHEPAAYCRSAFRHDEGMNGNWATGFRVCVVLSGGAAETAVASPTDNAPSTSDVPAAKEASPPEAGPDSRPLLQLPAVASLVNKNGKWHVPPGVAAAVAPFGEAKAKSHQEGWAKQLGAPVEITSSIGMKFTLIPPGEFLMGSPKELIDEEWNAHRDDLAYTNELPSEGPQHPARITRPFYLGTYLVTQQEYQRLTGDNPSQFSAAGIYKDRVAGQDTRRFPVENISWDQAVEFCKKLAEVPTEKVAGRKYGLPTEAQWEYACRAGNPGRFSFSPAGAAATAEADEQKLLDYAWFARNSGGNSGYAIHPVGGKRPNPWGLYDVYGNVCEWCRDYHGPGPYAGSAADDPAGPFDGDARLLRGGAFQFSPGGCRSACSVRNHRSWHDCWCGFRVCLVFPDK